MQDAAMPFTRATIVIGCCFLALSACRQFPEVEVSEAQFDRSTPYPEFVPVDKLLEEPDAEIDAEFQSEMTERAVDLEATPEGETSEDRQDPLLDRLDALRAKRDAQAVSDPIIPEDLRDRMQGGIEEPVIPE